MANIPDDIIHSCILPKLPVKSLLRFKCVSKSWLTLITSRDFIQFYHRYALSSDRNRLIITPVDYFCDYFHVYDMDAPHDPPSKCSYFIPEPQNSRVKVAVLASCEFFLLLGIGPWDSRYIKLFLVNPSTRSYHEIPRQNMTIYRNPLTNYGLCFDEANDEFKVIKITYYKDSDYPYVNGNAFTEVMMYSFKTNLWRLIERKLTSDVFFNFERSQPVYVVNNVLYTFRLSTLPNLQGYGRIGCFDIEAEQWTNDLPLPENNNVHYCSLRLLDGSICVIQHQYQNHRNHCVWVMKDRWVKLISVDCNNFVPDNRFEYQPITYRTGSQDELLCNRHDLKGRYWYSLRDKVAKNAQVNDEWGNHIELVCKGSLFMFPNLLPFPNQYLDDFINDYY